MDLSIKLFTLLVCSLGPPTCNANFISLVREDITEFAQSMYLYILNNSKSPNFVFSPLSLHSSLAMVYLGTTSKSETEKQLGQALGIPNHDILKQAYKGLLEQYSNQSSFIYGNKIWVQEGFEVKPKFVKDVKDNLYADVDEISFGRKASADIVNKWIFEKTGGKIRKLVDDLSPATTLFLANALYFKEEWMIPFEDKDIGSGENLEFDFHTINRGAQRVPMLEQLSSEIGYKEINGNGYNAEVLTIPYKNERFAMEIILPRRIRDLRNLEDNLKGNQIRDFNRGNGQYVDLFSDEFRTNPTEFVDDVYLRIPKFNVRTDMDAVGGLKSLGATKVFSPSAELNSLAEGDDPLYVSSVKHTALVEITKEGTEGAAATGSQIVLLSASIGVQKNIEVNRPFIFVVQDRINKIPVLIGRITDPSS